MSGMIARYPKALVVIHRITAAAVLGAWASAECGREVGRNPPLLHFTLGLAVLILALPRLMGGGAPAESRTRPPAAAAGQGLLLSPPATARPQAAGPFHC